MATNQQSAPLKSRRGYLLVASPHADGSPYRRAAVLMLEHNEQGAVGVVLDGSFRASVDQLRAQLPRISGLTDRATAAVAQIPVRAVIWEPGQLESELEHGLWLSTVADPALVFGESVPEWSELVRHVGRSVYREALGIEGFPGDVSLN